VLRNDRQHWGSVSRALHWLMAAMIAVQVPLGFLMVDAYDTWLATKGDPTLVMRLARAHNTMGFMVLILVMVRLGWRVSNPTPELPAALAAYQRILARITHGALYALLIIFPLTGWSALSAYDGEFPIFFFGWDNVPRIVPRVPEGAMFDADFFGEVHETCWKIGGVVLGLHVFAALWHEFVLKDGIARRMRTGSSH
jgi:cytochrome b561